MFRRIVAKLSKSLESVNRINLDIEGFIHASAELRGVRLSGKVTIGEGCRLLGGVTIRATSMVSIGKYSSITGPNSDIRSLINTVKIGSFCSIARNVSIQEYNHRFHRVSSYYMGQNIFKKDVFGDVDSDCSIVIGNDVWIGTQCVVLSGAQIGNGAIVAANSVVIGDVPAYSIVAGSPARVIKYRFSQDEIDILQRLEWWNWSLEKIKKNEPFFMEPFSLNLIKDIVDE
jgi:virginiamycin A acetyltransferase